MNREDHKLTFENEETREKVNSYEYFSTNNEIGEKKKKKKKKRRREERRGRKTNGCKLGLIRRWNLRLKKIKIERLDSFSFKLARGWEMM